MRCVVTGAAGFVGSSLVDRLLADGHEVLGIDSFVDYYPRAIKEENLCQARDSEKFEFIEGDLLSLDLPSILAGAELVFHQAAQAGVRASWGDSFSIYTDNNILATQQLLEAAKDIRVRETLIKIVFASSSSVYGNAETYPTTELMRPQPVSPYGVSKLASEHLMVLYSKEFAVPTVSLRYFTVYGPRQRPDMAFNRFMRSALSGEEILVFDDGNQSRDFTFISDIVQANILASRADTSENLVFNIGGGARVTVNQVIESLRDIIGSSVSIRYEERQLGDVKHTAADTNLAKNCLGYSPGVDLNSGLRAECDWMSSRLKS